MSLINNNYILTTTSVCLSNQLWKFFACLPFHSFQMSFGSKQIWKCCLKWSTFEVVAATTSNWPNTLSAMPLCSSTYIISCMMWLKPQNCFFTRFYYNAALSTLLILKCMYSWSVRCKLYISTCNIECTHSAEPSP